MEILIGIIALVWFLAVLHYVQRTAQILAQILKILDALQKTNKDILEETTRLNGISATARLPHPSERYSRAYNETKNRII